MSLKFTYITEDEGEAAKILLREFSQTYCKEYLRFGEEKVVLPAHYLNFADAIRDFEIRDDDVWVITHPKTGTTWTQEMVWCIGNDLDFENAKLELDKRFPFMDAAPLFGTSEILEKHPGIDLPDYNKDSVQYTANMPSPRYIKCHLPWSLLPQQIQDGTKRPKKMKLFVTLRSSSWQCFYLSFLYQMVYVCRNAKDTCLSYFHHCRLLDGFKGSFEDFCTMFIGDSVYYGPFWSHVLGFWGRRDQPNILFLKYEDMKMDLPSVIRETAQFLGKTLSDDQVNTLADHLSFENMKNNKAVNYDEGVNFCRNLGISVGEGTFMRSGKLGEGKLRMSTEMNHKFEVWIEENLRGTTLRM